MKLNFAIWILLLAATVHAQWTPQVSNTTAGLRGLSVVSENVVWASGTKGTFLRTTDGATWHAAAVPGAEALDFRDVHAVDANIAYLLAAGPGEASRIFKTSDAGEHWSVQFTNTKPKAFFDCMAFWDAQHGIAVSDPVEGHFLVIATSDGGAHWIELGAEKIPPSLAGEGAFAASGTCVAVQGKKNAWFVTGGVAGARVFRSTDAGKTWTVTSLPLATGKASTGAFSIAFVDDARGIAVGGDYQAPAEDRANAAFTTDGGKTWTLATTPPAGYRSAVAYIPGTRGPTAVAVGTTGSDYSLDGGKTWKQLSGDSFNAIAFAAAEVGWAVGPQGHIWKFEGGALGGAAPKLKK